MRRQITNKTICGLIIISLASLFMPGFMLFKRMRLVANETVSAKACLMEFFWVAIALTIVMLMLAYLDNTTAYKAIQGIAFAMLLGVLYFESRALMLLPLEAEEYSRLSFGPGMWLWLLSIAGLMIKINERLPENKIFVAFALLTLAGLVGLVATGKLDGLAIIKEYYANDAMYFYNLGQHIKLTIIVMIGGILIGVPLGYLVNQSKRVESITFSIINITETIPGISFIAIMMIPFAFLSTNFPELRKFGIVQFGAGPAVFALIFYAVFPIVHYTRAGFKMIGNDYVEVAKAMGMKTSTIFMRIMAPIALPEIMTGIRIASIYSVSGVTLASMCGGGGMGMYLLQGDSLDTVLIGAIPVIIMAFILDKGILWFNNRFTYRKTQVIN